MMADSTGNVCVKDGIPTWIFAGYLGLYLTIGFIRLFVANFMGTTQNIVSDDPTHQICCCKETSGEIQVDCNLDPSVSEHAICPSDKFHHFQMESSAFDKLADGTDACQLKFNTPDVSPAKSSHHSMLTLGPQAKQNIRRVAKAGIIILSGASIVAGALCVLDETMILPLVGLTVVYLLAKVVVFVFVVLMWRREKKNTAYVVTHVMATILDAATAASIAFRLAKPTRKFDITLMSIFQLAIQLQIGVFAESVSAKSEQANEKRMLMIVVAVTLLEAVSFPISIAVKLFNVSADAPAVGPLEISNLDFIANYFGMATAGLAIANTVVANANTKYSDKANRAKQYKKDLDVFRLDLEDNRFSDSAMAAACRSDPASPLVTHTRIAVIGLLVKMEADDACAFFLTKLKDNKHTRTAAVLEWKALANSQGSPIVCSELVEAELTPAERSLTPSPPEKCTALGSIIRSIGGHVTAVTKSHGISSFSTQFAFVALIADAYYGAVTSLIQDIPAMHSAAFSKKGNSFLNTMIASGLGVVMAGAVFATMFFTAE